MANDNDENKGVWKWLRAHLIDENSVISSSFAILCMLFVVVIAGPSIHAAHTGKMEHAFVSRSLPQSTAMLLAAALSYVVVYVFKMVKGDLKIDFGNLKIEGPVCGMLLWICGVFSLLVFLSTYRKEPNSPEPTTMSATDRVAHAPRQP